ncbi:MAG: Na(+)-translocating NADH-quinone reductase subunit A [Myxococcota bacterium]|nr:Na(+)-translocating NADH-quinone reductase subunit A [Myxococcota bacterium]
MAVHRIKNGLDLPITGAPKQEISDGEKVTSIAIVASDYPFMKPKMAIEEGDEVKLGQLLFEDRKTDGVRFTSPGAGKVVAINRGERRALQSVVIELAEDEEQVEFDTSKKSGEALRELLAQAGLWTALRARPFNKVPSPSETCSSIFVTAIDTNPLAASVEVVLEGRDEDWQAGIDALTELTEGPVWVCTRGGSSISAKGKNVQVESFEGPHPSGLVGTHIHMLDPVGPGKTVWHIGYQDVVAIGSFLRTGKLDVERVVSLAGPGVSEPRLVRTRLGANVAELTEGQLKASEEIRVISGSVLYGHSASGEIFNYLGRYHNQVSCLAEDRERVFFGWLRPGVDRFSIVRTYLSAWFGSKRFEMNTSTNGGHRANVPIGSFERVMPLDIVPTFLIRALLAGDIERAEQLGVLELDEEDLALCTFVSPGKEDFGVALRRTLTTIWKEG